MRDPMTFTVQTTAASPRLGKRGDEFTMRLDDLVARVRITRVHTNWRLGHRNYWLEEQARESVQPTAAERLVAAVTERGNEGVRAEIRKRREKEPE